VSDAGFEGGDDGRAWLRRLHFLIFGSNGPNPATRRDV
jgi:hypothetical protein